VLATNNRGKTEEFKALFTNYPEYEILAANEVIQNVDKIGSVETHKTYAENAAAKARLVGNACHYPSLADDTGLEVEALGGKPGVESHRFAKSPEGSSFSRAEQDKANVELLLSELNKKPGTRKAQFVCHLALFIEGVVITSRGVLEGVILDAPRGSNGFGYDSVFVPKGSKRTLAEMSNTEKNLISHRARAIHELVNQLKTRGIALART